MFFSSCQRGDIWKATVGVVSCSQTRSGYVSYRHAAHRDKKFEMTSKIGETFFSPGKKVRPYSLIF